MPSCDNPLWPCAMMGAAASLSGFDDIAVIIHGSSGCYFYPASLLSNPIYGTHLLESDIIFGSTERIREVIREVRSQYHAVAVVTTCVPSLVGEDLSATLEGYSDMVVDAAGFLGYFEEGYLAALEALKCRIDPDRSGVNIDGLNPIDSFYQGNRREAERLLSLIHFTPATRFCADHLDSVFHAAPFTLSTNPDLTSRVGTSVGNLLGFEGMRDAFSYLNNLFPETDLDPLMRELDQTEERIVRACDKFLRRHDPPAALVFGGASYSLFAASALHRYLSAEIIAIGSRNEVVQSPYPIFSMTSLQEIANTIHRERPDLVLGSTYEQSICGRAAFVPFTFPLRGRIALRTRTLVGLEGILSLMEDVLNACMDLDKENNERVTVPQ